MATRNIVPRANGEGSIGTAAKHWGAGHFDTLPNWQEYLAESTGYGIVSGCTPSISGLTVTVGAGIVHLADGTRKEIPSTNITLDAADSTNPRIDLVYINADGVVAKVTGTAAASPVAPSSPTGGISVAQVSVAANASTGTLTDVRGMLLSLGMLSLVTPEMFGAVGDGVTDDTDAVQAALDAGKRVLLRKKYAIDIEKHLFPKDNSIIIFENAELFGLPATQVSTNVYAEPIIFIKNVENITISGQGVINGNRYNQPTTPGTNEWASGIRIESSNNIKISDITIVDCCGDGIEIYAGNKNIFISNILCDNNRRQGLTVGGVDGCVVINSIFRNTNGTAPAAGIDVEVEASYYAKNVTISNCALFNNEIGILVGSKTSATDGYTIINLSITNCTALNNVSAGFRIEMKDGCTVSNCVAQKSSIGFWLRMCDGVILSNCSAKDNEEGLMLQTCSNVKVSGSMFFENSSRGIYIAQKSEDIYLSENNIYNNGSYGINIHGENVSFKNKNIDVINSLIFNNRASQAYNANTGEIFVSGEAESIRVCGCIIDKPSTSMGYAIYFSDNTYGTVDKCILASFAAGVIYNANKTSNNIIDNQLSQGTMDVHAILDSKPSTAKALIKDYEPNGTTKFFTIYWSNTSTEDGLVAQTNITGRVSKITNNQYIGECIGADGRRYYFTTGNWNIIS